jgi:hypothetical protein
VLYIMTPMDKAPTTPNARRFRPKEAAHEPAEKQPDTDDAYLCRQASRGD